MALHPAGLRGDWEGWNWESALLYSEASTKDREMRVSNTLFQQALGTPAVVCGPGNIAVAHKPDEHVSEAQMAQCDRMLERLVEKLSS